MIIKVRLFAATAAMILGISEAQAGPDDVTQTLINEEVSMLDWGIFRVEQNLQNNTDLRALGFVHVRYEWDDNTVEIYGGRGFDSLYSLHEARKLCKNWISIIRKLGGYNEGTQKLGPFNDVSNFAEKFGHEGYVVDQKNKEWIEIQRELDKKIWLNFWVKLAEGDESENSLLTCRGRLLASGHSETLR